MSSSALMKSEINDVTAVFQYDFSSLQLDLTVGPKKEVRKLQIPW